jgi:hypothetical protein
MLRRRRPDAALAGKHRDFADSALAVRLARSLRCEPSREVHAMLPQIPEMTMSGRIPLDTPLGALFVVALLAALAVGIATEHGLAAALRSLVSGGHVKRTTHAPIATAARRS